jgi:error-prone DNA polymerase
VHPFYVNASRWDCTLEATEDDSRFAVQLGMRMVKGLANAHPAAIVTARAQPGDQFRLGPLLAVPHPYRAG